jgi:divalent metal cation (Fe/Co/Zn/Cd) transporter
MADALTSVLAIAALLSAKYFGFIWMDPAMGIVGAILVARWSLGLLRTTSGVLLDRQGPESIRRKIIESIERDNDSLVGDLHLWSVGPNIYAVVIVVVAHKPSTQEEYKARIPKTLALSIFQSRFTNVLASVTEQNLQWTTRLPNKTLIGLPNAALSETFHARHPVSSKIPTRQKSNGTETVLV